MRTARAEAEVALAPEQALGLWTDLGRWPSFIEGFSRQVETDSGGRRREREWCGTRCRRVAAE